MGTQRYTAPVLVLAALVNANAQYLVLADHVTVGTTDPYSSRCMAKATGGGLYTAGVFNGTLIQGPDTLSTDYTDAIYLAKFDSALSLEWIRIIAENRVGVGAYHVQIAAASDGSGNLVLGISYTDELYFYGDSVGEDGLVGIELLKIDPTGELIWTRSVDGEVLGKKGVAVSEGGEIWVTGVTANDMFIAKYSANGTFLWSRFGGGPNNADGAQAIELDPMLNAYVVGILYPSNAVYFDSVHPTFPISAQSASFLAKYDPDGEIQWVRCIYSTTWAQFSWFTALQCDPEGNVLVAGHYADGLLRFTNGFSSVGPRPSGTPLSFLTAFNSTGNRLWVEVSDYTDQGYDRSIDMERNGNSVLVVNMFNGTVASGEGAMASQGGQDLRIQTFGLDGGWTSDLRVGGSSLDVVNSILTTDEHVFLLGSTSSHPLLVGPDTLEPPNTTNTFLLKLAEDPNGVVAHSDGQDVLVFPNPSSGYFTVQGLPNRAAFMITDLIGRVIHRDVADASGTAEVHLANAMAGLYVLHYRQGEAAICRKVLIGDRAERD